MLSRRRVLAVPLAAAGVMVTAKAPAFAQEATPAPAVDLQAGEGATIEVVGAGEATGEATGAILQFILRGTGGETDANGNFAPPVITEEQVAAVVAAVKKGGVPDAAVVSSNAATALTTTTFGLGSAVVAAELDATLLAKADRIIARVGAAGTGVGVLFDPVNVGYLLPDCRMLEEAALASAVADGAAQARSLAAALGVTLGPLLTATKQPSFGGPGYYGAGAGGTSSVCQVPPTLEDALRNYYAAYDASRPGEVELYLQVGMTFAIS